MASADLNCSICLNIFTDPVTLLCGHNYCQVCIDHVLDTQVGSGVYTCPECRAEFRTRPALQKNITLCNIVGSFLSSQLHQEETAIFCTYCIHSPVPAIKSCLQCECSLCEDHLRVHSKSAEHVLSDPTTSLEAKKCSVHKKILEYYCSEDNVCICVSCSLAGEHRGHQVEFLDVASGKKKEKLRKLLQQLTTKKEETEKRVQNLQQLRKEDQEKAAGLAEKATSLFRDIRRQLKDLEKKVLSEISRQEECASLPVFALIKQLEIKKGDLSREMHHIEELTTMTDPVTVLQAPDTSLFTAATENRATHDVQSHDVGHLDISLVTNTLHTLCDLITGLKGGIYKQKSTDVLPKAGTTNSDIVGVQKVTCAPKPADIALDENTAGNAESEIITGINIGNYVHGSTAIKLDVNTASNYISIGCDQNYARWSSITQKHPETKERFHLFNQVLSLTKFSSGQYYCVINVNSKWWSVGMSYPSIDRGGSQSHIGYNNKSWALRKGLYHPLSFIHDGKEIRLQNNMYGNSVGIYLDYEQGRMSFYFVDQGIKHLHTFTCTFTEPLHAAYCLGKGGSISGTVDSWKKGP